MEKEKLLEITSAVYKVLDFLPDSDPLKNKGKEKALAILENLTLVFRTQEWVSLYRSQNDRLSSIESGQKEKVSFQLINDIELLEDYLKIGKNQGWIDNMNFLIITKEYSQIKNSILSIKKPSGQSAGVTGDNSNLLPKTNEKMKVKEDLKSINSKESNDTSVLPLSIERYSQRQEKILKVLTEREKAQVSDFIKELPSVTKRTIRRDLDDLLKRGKITRIGQWNQVFYRKVDGTSVPIVELS